MLSSGAGFSANCISNTIFHNTATFMFIHIQFKQLKKQLEGKEIMRIALYNHFGQNNTFQITTQTYPFFDLQGFYSV